MLRITKDFQFSASHRLDHLPADHQCARLHGHNYTVQLELSAPREDLTPAGFVRDYGDLSDFKKWLDTELDHRHLNEVVPDLNPSAENLAMWIYSVWSERFPEITAVRVSETPKTWAEYRP
ncbi:6-pyruvoyl tetrahydropterin synthase family protein [Streptomyces canus]|uniref:6-pyruvoyl trahydropterin synthase family protein n=1 Tax=Streptomyces canus TaxID=58343 RepID=UPI002E2D2025|nr:6-pyruvoyl tetrahydropterin synthase family protein [Streptomyces canus]